MREARVDYDVDAGAVLTATPTKTDAYGDGLADADADGHADRDPHADADDHRHADQRPAAAVERPAGR